MRKANHKSRPRILLYGVILSAFMLGCFGVFCLIRSRNVMFRATVVDTDGRKVAGAVIIAQIGHSSLFQIPALWKPDVVNWNDVSVKTDASGVFVIRGSANYLRIKSIVTAERSLEGMFDASEKLYHSTPDQPEILVIKTADELAKERAELDRERKQAVFDTAHRDDPKGK